VLVRCEFDPTSIPGHAEKTAVYHGLGSEVAASDSAVDNVELIYQSALPPGNYALVARNPSSSTTTAYALVWHSLPAVTSGPLDPAFTARDTILKSAASERFIRLEITRP
jgi:hypothetical protein